MSQQPLTPILELAGLPASGKTTTAKLVGEALSVRNMPFRLIPEAASVAPIQHLKRHWFFNAWTLCTIVKEYLETDLSDEDAKIIVDRGFVDCLCWIMWFTTTGRIDGRTAKALEGFARTSAWFDKTALTVALSVPNSASSARRERQDSERADVC